MQNRIPLAWGLFLLVIGLTVAAILLTSPAPVPTGFQKDPRVQTFEDMKADGGQAIYIEDQAAEATEVRVGYAVCATPCFVEIFDDANGVPGEQIGVSEPLPEGGEHLTVPLSTPLLAGQVYYAMLRKDDGDGVFIEANDPPLTNAKGVTAIMSFLAGEGNEPETEAVMP